ncbi:MAG: ABC transporter permease [Eubacteriales bacterium]|nr:ABC transporter permease [Eubacteriales bacterium]
MRIVSFLISAVRVGMSFLLGSTGETITEKSGHLNLGIPGIMCVGAAFGCITESFYVTSCGGIDNVNNFLAVLLPILASFAGGGMMGLLYSFLTVSLRANQNVTGLALTTLGSGLSNYMIAQVSGSSYAQASKIFTRGLAVADRLGVFGRLVLSYGPLVYLAIIIALAASWMLTRTRIGLNLRAVGENPATADAAGISVTRYRYVATVIGSGIAGIGGLCYIMDNLNGGWEYTIDAIGWLAIALVIFTLWKPNIGIIGSIVFGAFYVVSSYITGVSFNFKAIIKMLPYVMTLIVLVFTSFARRKENQPPEALGLPYFREDR